MNSLRQCDSLQFGTVVGQNPTNMFQQCSSSVPAGSRQIPNVISNNINMVYVMELSEPHQYARLSV
jgi:glutaredoxin